MVGACVVAGVWLTVMAAEAATPNYRLPDNLIPTNYILNVFTHLDGPDYSFNGTVWIRVRCIKTTSSVILHASNLTVREEGVSVKEVMSDDLGSRFQVLNVRMAPETEFLVIKTANPLRAGKIYLIKLDFEGALTEGLSGYYRSQYFDMTANDTKWLAVTQFEPTDARKAFPCFDEPAMKATFKINLGHKQGLKAISNMPLLNSTPIEEREGWVLDSFMETVPMSTYLVSYLVGELEYREAPPAPNNVTMRVWARKDAIDQTEFAAKVAPQVLQHYEQYFDVRYPLPKQDMAAIPDFSAGAMENWGLITYRETALLFEPKSSSSAHQHSITSVIAHELAHQWFGNLVTMKWWTDLWLNEGFATYVGAIGVHHVYPDWNSLDSTSLENIMTVFNADALKSSHPVSIPIGKASEINQIFDYISYKKGSSLLRMMNHFLGEEAFKSGVSAYLKKHAYENAEQDDLWASLTAAGKAGLPAPVKEIMDSWTLQTGYPLVTATRDYEAGTVTLTQKRYLQVRSGKEAEDKSCWWVPVTWATPDKGATQGLATQARRGCQPGSKECNTTLPKPDLWMNCAQNRTVTISGLDKDQYLLLNLNIAGLFRVQYDAQNWALLAGALNSDTVYQISPMDRAYLISNILELAWAGDTDYPTALTLVAYLKREDAFLPWRTAYYSLSNIDRMLRRTPCYGHFRKFMGELVTPIYSKFGKLTEIPKTFEKMKHHTTIMSWACKYGVGSCRDQARQLFQQWRKQSEPDKNNPVPSDIKALVYCLGVQSGGEEAWHFLWERYLGSNVGTEKSLILSALGCSKEVWILKRYLAWSIDEKSGIRKQDSVSVFSSVARQDVGFYVARDFLFDNVKLIHDYHGLKNSRMGRYLLSYSDNIIQDNELNQWMQFTGEHKDLLKYNRLAAEQSVESAVSNTRWQGRHYEHIAGVLRL